jgi:hypothetical protein
MQQASSERVPLTIAIDDDGDRMTLEGALDIRTLDEAERSRKRIGIISSKVCSSSAFPLPRQFLSSGWWALAIATMCSTASISQSR